jgi:hypothetical protein
MSKIDNRKGNKDKKQDSDEKTGCAQAGEGGRCS